jgi:RNA polymerase sigma factor (sigma-70 family)
MNTLSREADWMMWMRAALAGDSGAYRKFLHSVAPHIRAVARSRCRRLGVQESEVEDIVQEVLLTIHLKQATWDRSRAIGPWVSAITRNKIIDALRRRGRRIDVPIADLLDTLPAEERPPECSTSDIDVLIGKLPSQQQAIVRSISLNGVSISETAGQLKMTEGAVRVSLHRSLKALGALYRSSVDED